MEICGIFPDCQTFMFKKGWWQNGFQKQYLEKCPHISVTIWENFGKNDQCFPAKDLEKEITVEHIWTYVGYKSVIWLQVLLYFSNYAYHLTFSFSISEMLDNPFGSSAKIILDSHFYFPRMTHSTSKFDTEACFASVIVALFLL